MSRVNPTQDNYANLDPEFMDEQITYDNFKQVQISLPANIGLLGTTGSGKSNYLLNFIKDLSVFNKIFLYASNLDQPLYKSMIKKIRDLEKKSKTSILEVFDNIDDVKSPDEFDQMDNVLCIFDDFQNEKVTKQKNIVDLFTKGRSRSITNIYIAQTYFKGIPSVIRGNLQYLIIFKVESTGDLGRICADKALGIDKKQLMNLFLFV